MQIPDLCAKVLSQYSVELGKYLALYKTLHQCPELPLFESETAQLVAAHLRALSFMVFTSIGGHGVVGVLGNGAGKTVLLRSELDALPIREETNLPYASVKRMFDENGEQQPVMHACGHDIHMTCLLGAAEILHASKKHWSGTVIALFQPNEEYVGGAQAMITAGLYEKVPRPDVMLAQHVGSERCGRVGVTPGVILPASINVHVSLVSHGTAANPQDCGDLIAVASFIIGRLQTIAASELNPRKYGTLICRRFIADSLFVKPPSNVEMVLELRSTDTAIEKQALAAIERMVLSECNTAPGRVQATISSTIRFPITRNDTHSASALQTSFKDYFGENFYVPDMILAGEDFSWLGPDIPYVYWILGGTRVVAYDEAEKQGRVAELIPFPHSPSFAPDPEATIQSGILAMSLAALTFLDVQEGVGNILDYIIEIGNVGGITGDHKVAEIEAHESGESDNALNKVTVSARFTQLAACCTALSARCCGIMTWSSQLGESGMLGCVIACLLRSTCGEHQASCLSTVPAPTKQLAL